jgi:hypothetical protein
LYSHDLSWPTVAVAAVPLQQPHPFALATATNALPFVLACLQFGLGGGVGACNNVSGTGGSNLGIFPWLGISSSQYRSSSDPFKQSQAAQAYLRSYYKTALDVLSKGGVGGYKVDAAYIWNVGSWDVQGIHTASAEWNTAVAQGDWPVRKGYADAGVIAAIKAHNAKAS